MSRQKSIFPEAPVTPDEFRPVPGDPGEAIAAPHADLRAVPERPAVAEAGPAPFELELRRLVRLRLSGELGYEEFCRRNLELHFRHGRRGYDLEQYERDLQEYRERERRAQRRRHLERAMRSKLDLLEPVPPHQDDEVAAHKLGA